MSWFRHHHSNRVLRFALLAGSAAIAVALTGLLLARALDGASAAGAAPAGTSPARSAAGDARERGPEARTKHEHSSRRRIRLGQSLSMTTLKPLEAKHRMPVRKVQSRGRQGRTWNLVAFPANAKVIHRPGASTFTPDVHGTYIFERKVGKARGGNARPRTLILHVEPAEQLLCVNTRVFPVGEEPSADTPPLMKVGDHEFDRPRPAGPWDPPYIQVVVLDRATAGAPHDAPANSTFLTTRLEGYKTLLSSLDNSHLVLVSGFVVDETKEAVWGPLERLGAADIDIPIDGGLEFSLIGIPGIARGSAWQTTDEYSGTGYTTNSCDSQEVGQPETNLSGWLTRDTTGRNYTYVSPDLVDFDTEASALAGKHAVSVGNQTYTVPTGQWNGFHAVVLDRRAMCPKVTAATCKPAPPLLNRGFGQENGGLDALNAALAPFLTDPDVLLFLASFTGTSGSVPNVVPSVELITTLRKFGASPLAPGRSLDGGVKYALVGSGKPENGFPDGTSKPIVAESFTEFKGTGHIAGTLVRDHQNRFGPRQASLTGTPLDRSLGEIVYASTSSWPEEGNADLEAAFRYLSGKIGYPVDTQHPHGVRDQYLSWTKEADVPAPSSRLDPTWCTDPQSPVDADACTTVFKELYDELLEVKNVNGFLQDLHDAYFEVAGGGDANSLMTRVKEDLQKNLTPPPTKTSIWLPFAQFVLSLASAIPEVGEPFAVAGAYLDWGQELLVDEDGGSTDPLQVVYDTGDELVAAASEAYEDAADRTAAYQPLIVSDHKKLDLVGRLAAKDPGAFKVDPNQPAPWNFGEYDLEALRSGLKQALKQWLYPPLVNAGFPVWQIVIPSTHGFNPADRTPVTYRCKAAAPNPVNHHPFASEPADGWMKLSNGHADYYLALGGTRYSPSDLANNGHHAPVPDAGLLTSMFGPTVGVNKTWYFEQMFKKMLDTGGTLVLDC
jgi:hypothetical protein